MRSILLLVSSVVLGACVSNTIVLETDEGSETGGGGPPATTTPGSADGPGSASAPGSATAPGTSTTTAGPSSAVTTDAPPPDVPEPVWDLGIPPFDLGPLPCDPPCPPGQVCVAGLCFDEPDECGAVGQWADCLLDDGTFDDTACMSPDGICVADAVGNPSVAGCFFDHCDEPCDCPLAPLDGDAPVACEMLIGDGDGDCFLDCSGGQQCPSGMVCFADLACLFPA